MQGGTEIADAQDTLRRTMKGFQLDVRSLRPGPPRPRHSYGHANR